MSLSIQNLLASPKFNRITSTLGNTFAYVLISTFFIAIFSAMVHISTSSKGDVEVGQREIFIQKDTTLGQNTFLDDVAFLKTSEWITPQSFSFFEESGVVWVKFDLPRIAAESSLIMQFKDPLLDVVRVAIVKADSLQDDDVMILQGGDTVSFKQRSISTPHLVFNIPRTTQPSIVYVAIQSQLAFDVDFAMWQPSRYLVYHDNYTTLFGITFGYFFALVCFGVVMYSSTKNKEYLWYCGFSITYLAHVSAISGFGFQHMWSHLVNMQQAMGAITSSLGYFFLIGFSIALCNTTEQAKNKTTQTNSKRMIGFLLWCNAFVFLICIIFKSALLVKFALVFGVFISFIMPLLCWSYRKTAPEMSYFLTTIWLIIMVVSLGAILDRIDALGIDINPVFILLAGFYLKTLLLAIALIYSYRNNMKETAASNAHAIIIAEQAINDKIKLQTLQSEAKDKLNQQVEAQTAELQTTLESVRYASNELKKMVNVDALTKLKNRAGFELAFCGMINQAISSDACVTVVVLDMDHFKKVNDTYGHTAGDDCLVAFSSMLTEHLPEASFITCRYGGEEFLAASTLSVEKVFEYIDKVRHILSETIIISGALEVPCTISAGMVSEPITPTLELEALIDKADQRLYQAKQDGRNRVLI